MKIDALCKQIVKPKIAENSKVTVLGSPLIKISVTRLAPKMIGNTCRPASSNSPTEMPEIIER